MRAIRLCGHVRRWCWIPFLGLLLPACSSGPHVTPQELNREYRKELTDRDTWYRIKPADTLSISFFDIGGGDAGDQGDGFGQLNLLVLPDGRTDPFFMDHAVVAGKTLKEFERDIKSYYANQIIDPVISVQVKPAEESVYLEGEVQEAGAVVYRHRMTLSQLLAASGGTLDTGSLDDVILRRPYRDYIDPDIYLVDLYDESAEIILLPNDHIVIKRTWWIVVRDYLEEYIWRLLPPLFFPFASAL